MLNKPSCRRRPASSTTEALDPGLRRDDNGGQDDDGRICQGFLKQSLRFLFLALAIAWAGVIFHLSSQTSIDTPSLFPGQDKLFHMIAFGMLGFLLMGSMKTTGRGYRTGQVWFVVAVVVIYGVLDEFHQSFVPGRMADIYDVLADATGALLGAWTMYYLVKILSNRTTARLPTQQ